MSGPNELTRRGSRRWPGELAGQFTQPLAVLLTIAAALAWLSGTPRLGIVPALNSLFGTAPLTGGQLATVLPFPFIVWGADEFRRLLVRRHAANNRLVRN